MSLENAVRIPGAYGVALIAAGTPALTWWTGGNPPAPAEVKAAAGVALSALALVRLNATDTLDDILITSTTAFHVLRLVRGEDGSDQVAHLMLRRAGANLAMARREFRALTEGPLPANRPGRHAKPPEPEPAAGSVQPARTVSGLGWPDDRATADHRTAAPTLPGRHGPPSKAPAPAPAPASTSTSIPAPGPESSASAESATASVGPAPGLAPVPAEPATTPAPAPAPAPAGPASASAEPTTASAEPASDPAELVGDAEGEAGDERPRLPRRRPGNRNGLPAAATAGEPGTPAAWLGMFGQPFGNDEAVLERVLGSLKHL
ncbi:hypothetical protein [Actinoplanes friuliensis]|uniref:Uncharacterized protein n=1 Tax=Actinoplanes friuliensis DSM 7358 TaxID=1246995 RepID=U5WA01_9ACTN|nr:hypothetical protein [Actinoplanes friuliensis]AGZ44751.1 hypothetical protein AFR_32465 [Actinoplanes friuliensis DSM 7358]